MPRLATLALVLLFAALALGARDLRAQALDVRAVDALTGQPIAGAILEVRDAAGALRWQGVLGGDGRRLVRVGTPGSYALRLRRIGYEPVAVPPVTVEGTATLEVPIRAAAQRVLLDAVFVQAERGGRTSTGEARRCRRDAFASASFATLWEQVRTALTATVLSREGEPLVVEARAFRRVLDDDRRVRAEYVGLPRVSDVERPYVARPAAELAREGYIRRVDDDDVFHAPDEQVLLSDEFEADHCFEVTRGDGPTAGLFGVSFIPASRRQVNDIAGTLWVDSASAELRHLDFWYVNDSMPRPAQGSGRSGGQVIFERLPTGRWIVSAWRLRMPRFAEGRVLTRQSPVSGFEELGGVIRVASGGGAGSRAADDAERDAAPSVTLAPYLELLAPARLAGTIHDSLAGRPLSGAQVWLVPFEQADDVAMGLVPEGGTLAITGRRDTTDADGRYALDDVPAGSWRLGFEHPALDSLGVLPTRYELRLRPGATVIGDLAVPSLATLAAGCRPPPGTPPASRGLVYGIVRSAVDGRPLANALVRASWSDLARRDAAGLPEPPLVVNSHTDSLGFYRVCGVADSTIVNVQAAGPTSRSGEVDAVLGPLGVTRVNLRLAETEDGAPLPRSGTLVGVVRDTGGAPLVDSRVTVDGLEQEMRTDAAGRFRFVGVPLGTQSIEVRSLGMAPARRAVDVGADDSTVVSLVLSRTQLLDAIAVTAERRRTSPALAAALRRSRSGFGTLYTAEEIQARPTLRSLLLDIPGVRLVPGAGNMDVPLMRRPGLPGGECEARLFVDGLEQDHDYLRTVTIDDIAALEVFTRVASAPMFTTLRSRP